MTNLVATPSSLKNNLKLNGLLLLLMTIGLLIYWALKLLHSEVLLLSAVLLSVYALLPAVNSLEALIKKGQHRLLGLMGMSLAQPQQDTKRYINRCLGHVLDHGPRLVSVLVVLISSLTLISMALTHLLPPLKDQLMEVVDTLSRYWPSRALQPWLGSADHPQLLQNFFKHHALEGAKSLLLLVSHSLLGMIHVIVALVLVFYILLDGKPLFKGLLTLLPSAKQTVVGVILYRVHALLYTFMKTQVTLACVASLALYGLCHLLGIQSPLLLGLCFGLGSILPVLGPWLGLLPTLLLVLLSHPDRLVALLLGCMVFYASKELWLLPALEADNPEKGLEIHPLLVMIAFLLCLQLAGLAGILLIVPLATGMALAYECLLERLSRVTAPLEVT
jgi:predicted PurR-regulated permease PerM